LPFDLDVARALLEGVSHLLIALGNRRVRRSRGFR
jgi:hypothetical protein